MPNYGSAGLLATSRNRSDFDHLPEWLRRQVTPVSEDESGIMWGFNGIYDQQGRQVNQIGQGDPNDRSTGDMSLVDPSAFWDDPTFGTVTSPANQRHVMSDAHRNGRTATQIAVALMGAYGAGVAGGFGGEAMAGNPFAGAVAEGSVGAGEGLFGGLGSTGSNPFAGSVAEGGTNGIFGPSTGIYNGGQINVTAPPLTDVAPISGGGLGGLGAGASLLGLGGGSGNPFDGAHAEGEVGGEGNWYDGILNGAMRNPMQTLGLLQSLYGLAGGSGNSGGGGGGSGDSGAKGGAGTPVGMGVSRGEFQPNPHTQRQLRDFTYAQARGY